MKVLVTGSRGLVGGAVLQALSLRHGDAEGYDREDGRDILDAKTLRAAIRGCDAVIHSAALLGRPGESADQITKVNVEGTRNVLAAGRAAGVRRIVFLSSVDVFGVFKGERAPDYLPLDDAHPCYVSTPYGLSKRSGEAMCRSLSEQGGPLTICLRPPGVWSDATYRWIQASRRERAEFEWSPFWEYGAFIDVRDLAQACVAAVHCELDRPECLSVASPDISTSGRTSREWATFVHPSVEWRGGAEYEADPYRGLIRIDKTCGILGWQPIHTWRSFMAAGDRRCP